MGRFYLLVCLLVAVLVQSVVGDCYGHNPRMSNNRLANNNQNQARLFDSQNNAQGGYCWGPPLSYYEQSILSVEWTSQHSCGNDNTQCQYIFQYLCSASDANGTVLVRDGTSETAITNQDPMATDSTTGEYLYGMHEPQSHYKACTSRSRNKGLFTADQNLGNTAMNTRQNAGGGQSGYECNEERDYYPYWQPSPWKDIAVLTTDTSNCKYYKSESQNVKSKNYCSGSTTNPQPVMEQDCLSSGGKWMTAPSHGIGAPECLAAPWNRDNHLGNGNDGYQNRYNWTLPNAKMESCINSDVGCSCVLRIRYNISTADTTNWGGNAADSRLNGVNSPITGDPDVLVSGMNLTLAVNTDQYGRTFQDRSHSFKIISRPKGVSSSAKIYNLNVRGKRGNIVQTYPATEYDFTPQHLQATVGDYVHFQWTGCDTNPAGNAGEGLDSTDRSNIVQISGATYNYPMSDSQLNSKNSLFDSSDTRKNFALLGQTNCLSYEDLQNSNTDPTQNPQNCGLLNNADAYFNGGLHKMNKTGTFYYMSTRNNNFSNRSQKGVISIRPVLYGWQIGLISTACVVVALVGAAAGCVVYAKMKPHSKLATYVGKVPLINRI